MIKPKKVRNMPTDDEMKNVQDLDWDTYFRKHYSEESMSLYNCPKCNVILVRQAGENEITCYSCGEKLIV